MFFRMPSDSAGRDIQPGEGFARARDTRYKADSFLAVQLRVFDDFADACRGAAQVFRIGVRARYFTDVMVSVKGLSRLNNSRRWLVA